MLNSCMFLQCSSVGLYLTGCQGKEPIPYFTKVFLPYSCLCLCVPAFLSVLPAHLPDCLSLSSAISQCLSIFFYLPVCQSRAFLKHLPIALMDHLCLSMFIHFPARLSLLLSTPPPLSLSLHLSPPLRASSLSPHEQQQQQQQQQNQANFLPCYIHASLYASFFSNLRSSFSLSVCLPISQSLLYSSILPCLTIISLLSAISHVKVVLDSAIKYNKWSMCLISACAYHFGFLKIHFRSAFPVKRLTGMRGICTLNSLLLTLLILTGVSLKILYSFKLLRLKLQTREDFRVEVEE